MLVAEGALPYDPSMKRLGHFDDLPVATLERVARECGLDLLLVHGSVASGATHARSDVDFAARHADGVLSPERWLEVFSALSAAVPQREVDVVDLSVADPLLLRRIMDSGRIVFDAGGVALREGLRALHRYEDFRPYLRLEADAVRREIQRQLQGHGS